MWSTKRCHDDVWIFLAFLVQALTLGGGEEPPPPCSTKWLSGYRLASAQPQKTLLNLSLKDCEDECLGTSGCGAFAFGTLPPFNNTCELALALSRTARSTPKNTTNFDPSPPYTVYLLDKKGVHCGRSYLMERERDVVPIDCFYRLLSGKRLSKPHSLKSISVSSLPECQDACIREISFQCRSISYRYMPSGYSYSVSNCELSPFYLMNTNQPTNHDFTDDFDYDYFQREPFCKTSGGGGGGGAGGFGVCAVVVRRGGRISSSLIKSSHQTSTPSQCEHLCTTALFRCRAFAFRHTDRGTSARDPFHRNPVIAPCQLYESDLSRLPSYNVDPDADFDLYEMGRLSGGECMLQGQGQHQQGQYGQWGGNRDRPVTSPSSSSRDWFGQGRERERERERYPMGGGGYYDRYPPTSNYPPNNYNDRDYNRDYPPRGGSDGYYTHPQQGTANPNPARLPGDRTNYFQSFPESSQSSGSTTRFETPVGDNKRFDTDRRVSGGGGVGGGGSIHQYEKEPPVPMGLLHQEKQKEIIGGDFNKACLTRLRNSHPPGSSLIPELARATFPVKTLEECSLECLRSLQVLRFSCRVLSFRPTSPSGGGTCQLSSTPGHTLREGDFVANHHNHGSHRDAGVVLMYDEGLRGCERPYENENRRNDDYYSHQQSRYGGGGYPNSGSSVGGRYGWSNSGTGWSNNNNQNYNSNYGSTNYGSNYGSNYNHQSQHRPYYPQNSYNTITNSVTVDGEPCLHSCVRNNEAGFYYCQTDHEGAWNFCCRPDDGQCGYSRGLSFAWCYVGTGPSRDVWRTCKRTPSHPPTTVQYLHHDKPPAVVVLNGEQPLGNLTVGGAVELLREEGSGESEKNGKNETIIITKN